MQIQNNHVVSMHYTLTLESGETVDSSVEHEPLQFLTGQQQIIPGLEREILNLQPGDKKSVTVAPEDGYGLVNEDLTQTVGREQIPADVELKEGLALTGQNADGQQFQVIVKSFNDAEVELDMNHPLAGETLHFDIEIIDVRPATPEEIDHGHVH